MTEWYIVLVRGRTREQRFSILFFPFLYFSSPTSPPPDTGHLRIYNLPSCFLTCLFSSARLCFYRSVSHLSDKQAGTNRQSDRNKQTDSPSLSCYLTYHSLSTVSYHCRSSPPSEMVTGECYRKLIKTWSRSWVPGAAPSPQTKRFEDPVIWCLHA